jgi:hypothetical protein
VFRPRKAAQHSPAPRNAAVRFLAVLAPAAGFQRLVVVAHQELAAVAAGRNHQQALRVGLVEGLAVTVLCG